MAFRLGYRSQSGTTQPQGHMPNKEAPGGWGSKALTGHIQTNCEDNFKSRCI